MFSILTYGSNCWTISRTIEKRFEDAEMWFYWHLLYISWMDHISNDEVLSMIGRNGLLLSEIRMWPLKFLGHITWKDSLEKVILNRNTEGKRDHRKQRLTYLCSTGICLEKKTEEIIHMAGDRGKWRSMIADILLGQDTWNREMYM